MHPRIRTKSELPELVIEPFCLSPHEVLRSRLIIQSIIYWWRIIRGENGGLGLTNFLPQKSGVGGGAYWEEGAYLSTPGFNIRDWEGSLIEDLRDTWHDPVRKISSSAAKPLRCLGLWVRQVLEILLERTYSYPKFPVLCGIGRRVESKTADKDHRRSGA